MVINIINYKFNEHIIPIPVNYYFMDNKLFNYCLVEGNNTLLPTVALVRTQVELKEAWGPGENPYEEINEVYTYFPIEYDPFTGEKYEFEVTGEIDVTNELERIINQFGSNIPHEKREQILEERLSSVFPNTFLVLNNNGERTSFYTHLFHSLPLSSWVLSHYER